MNLLYIGNFEPPFSTESTWRRAFERLGHVFDPIQQEAAQNMGPDLFYDFCAPRKPEVVFYSRTHNHTALGTEWTKTWRRLENEGVKTCALHLDLFWGLERERERLVEDGDPLFTMGLVCTPDGGHSENWTQNNVEHRWLPPAVDAECVGWADPDSRYECDVLFVGSGGYHPDYPERPELIDKARARWGDRFLHVGPDGIGSIRGPELGPVIAASKVVLGDACFALNPSRQVPYYWSDRVPETLGRAGLLVHPSVDGLADIHDDMVFAPPSVDGLIEAANDVLSWPDGLQYEMRLNAVSNVRDGHTYDHRAQQVLTWLAE